MRRWIWWAGVLAAAALVGVGSVVAYQGYTRSTSPQDAVRGYLDALARSDAPAALGAGDVPAGTHTFLTSTVLRTQQRRAPIRDIAVVATTRDGSTAEVNVRYTRGGSAVRDTLAVHEHGGSWRLDRVAVATTLRVAPAADRTTLFGAPVPTGAVLLFPGALPIDLDTRYLRLAPGHEALTFGAGQVTDVPVQMSAAGRRAAQAGVLAALRRCLTDGAVGCPVPGSRYVPGTLHGTITGHPALTTALRSARAGVVDVEGSVAVDGRYRRLTFENVAAAGRGAVTVPVHAALYALRPSVVVWSQA